MKRLFLASGATSILLAAGIGLIIYSQYLRGVPKEARPKTVLQRQQEAQGGETAHMRKESAEESNSRSNPKVAQQASTPAATPHPLELVLRGKVVNIDGSEVSGAWVTILEPASALEDFGFPGFGSARAERPGSFETEPASRVQDFDDYCEVAHATAGQNGDFEFRLPRQESRILIHATSGDRSSSGSAGPLKPSRETVVIVLRAHVSLQCQVYSSEGEFIQDARVRVKDDRTTTSGTTGRFGLVEIADLLPGNYLVTAHHPHYAESSKELQIVASEQKVKLSLPPLPNGVEITGTVYDERRGNGVPGVDVVLRIYSDQTTITDSFGRFRFAVADLEQTTGATFIIQSENHAPHAERIQINPKENQPFTIRIHGAAGVEVQVKDEANTPIAGAQVALRDQSVNHLRYARTRHDGTCSFWRLRPGSEVNLFAFHHVVGIASEYFRLADGEGIYSEATLRLRRATAEVNVTVTNLGTFAYPATVVLVNTGGSLAELESAAVTAMLGGRSLGVGFGGMRTGRTDDAGFARIASLEEGYYLVQAFEGEHDPLKWVDPKLPRAARSRVEIVQASIANENTSYELELLNPFMIKGIVAHPKENKVNGMAISLLKQYPSGEWRKVISCITNRFSRFKFLDLFPDRPYAIAIENGQERPENWTPVNLPGNLNDRDDLNSSRIIQPPTPLSETPYFVSEPLGQTLGNELNVRMRLGEVPSLEIQ